MKWFNKFGKNKKRQQDDIISEAEGLWVSPEGEFNPVSEHTLALREMPEWFGLSQRDVQNIDPKSGDLSPLMRKVIEQGFLRYRYFSDPRADRHLFDISSYQQEREKIHRILYTKLSQGMAFPNDNVSIIQKDGKGFDGTVDEVLEGLVRLSSCCNFNSKFIKWSFIFPKKDPKKWSVFKKQ